MGVFKRLTDQVYDALEGLRDFKMLDEDQRWQAVLYVANLYEPIPDTPSGEVFQDLFEEWFDAKIKEDNEDEA
jgi:hypothetical protein